MIQARVRGRNARRHVGAQIRVERNAASRQQQYKQDDKQRQDQLARRFGVVEERSNLKQKRDREGKPEPEPEPVPVQQPSAPEQDERADKCCCCRDEPRWMIGLLCALTVPVQPSLWAFMILCDGQEQRHICDEDARGALYGSALAGLSLPVVLTVWHCYHAGGARAQGWWSYLLQFLGFISFSVSVLGFVPLHQWILDLMPARDYSETLFAIMLPVALGWTCLFAVAMFKLDLGGSLPFDRQEHNSSTLNRGSSLKAEMPTEPFFRWDGVAADKVVRVVVALALVVTLYIFQIQHFDVEAQHDVHASLRQDLHIHIESKDSEGDFRSVVDADSMFDWLSSRLLPRMSQSKSYDKALLPPVTQTEAQCRNDLESPPWWHPHHSQLSDKDRTALSASCGTCGEPVNQQHDGPHGSTTATGHSDLTFLNEYELLYQGVVIRQKPHCAMVSVHPSVDGGYLFHRSARPGVDCKESTQFKQVSRKITASMSDHSIPAQGCYRFDLEELRHRESTPADQRDWIRRARMTKSEIFIPTSTVNASALDAAQTLLEFAKEARWVDPTTAEVEVSFLVMSLEYAMLSEVALKCEFHLGGYVETDFSMRSTVASVFEPVRLSLALPCLLERFISSSVVVIAAARFV